MRYNRKLYKSRILQLRIQGIQQRRTAAQLYDSKHRTELSETQRGVSLFH